MKAYITHYTRLSDRIDPILNTAQVLGLEPVLITAFDKEDLPNDLTSIYQFSSEEWYSKLQIISSILKINAGVSVDCPIEAISWLSARQLKLSEISLTLKHMHALLQIAASKEPAVIMEDDVLVDDNSYINFTQVLQYSTQLDYIDLAGGCNLPIFPSDQLIANIGAINLYLMSPPRSRNTAAYLITPEASLKLLCKISQIIFPLDWSFQFAFSSMNIRVGWANPPLLLHGSMGHYQSSIQ